MSVGIFSDVGRGLFKIPTEYGICIGAPTIKT